MLKSRIMPVFLAAGLLVTQTGCWNSREIEDLSMYVGVALDEGKPTVIEQELEEQGGSYPKRNLISATVQIVPMNTAADKQQADKGQGTEYLNTTETGDSLFEIMRQYAIRREHSVIGHHLKVIVISRALAQRQSVDKLLDFALRDNDIRPSCLVLLSKGMARETLTSKRADQIPAFKLRDMLHGRFRNNRIMESVNLIKLNGWLGTKQSFILQEVAAAGGETEFSGAGIIKGETGKWIGSLSQMDVSNISWIKGDVQGGLIKSYDWRNEPITYEVKSANSKITSKLKDNRLSFRVSIESEGRLIENWDSKEDPSKSEYQEKVTKIFEKRLLQMLETTMRKMQSTYKVDVAGFGDRLRIERPKYWKKVKDRWDDVFSQTPVSFDIKFTITDIGSSTQ